MSKTDASSKGWITFGPEQRKYVDGLEQQLACAAARIAELEKVLNAATEYIRDSYRPSVRYDAERFDRLKEAIQAANKEDSKNAD